MPEYLLKKCAAGHTTMKGLPGTMSRQPPDVIPDLTVIPASNESSHAQQALCRCLHGRLTNAARANTPLPAAGLLTESLTVQPSTRRSDAVLLPLQQTYLPVQAFP